MKWGLNRILQLTALWCLDSGCTELMWQEKKDLEIEDGQKSQGMGDGQVGGRLEENRREERMERMRNASENEDNCWYLQLKELQSTATHQENNKIVLFGECSALVGFPQTMLCFSARVSLMFHCVWLPVSRHCSICQTWSGHGAGAAIRNCLAAEVMWRTFLLSPPGELWDSQPASCSRLNCGTCGWWCGDKDVTVSCITRKLWWMWLGYVASSFSWLGSWLIFMSMWLPDICQWGIYKMRLNKRKTHFIHTVLNLLKVLITNCCILFAKQIYIIF